MADPFRPGSSGPDSAQDLLADWNIGDSDESGSSLGSAADGDPGAEPQDVASGNGPSPVARRLAPSGQGRALQVGFGVEESPGEWSVGLGTPGLEAEFGTTRKRVRDAETAGPVAGGTAPRDGDPDPAADRSRGPGSLPHPGDQFAGFRIIRELGRGAFARVYLAEEIHLGRRLVAIKVSQSEGDEPQILARLQHTHIVPVYSVYDDPESGLRVLCMPYFGGANLAQVLDAAGGLVTAERAGRSLVEALDAISRHLPASAGPETLRPSRPLRSTRPNHPAAIPASAPGRPLLGGVDRSLVASRFRWFLSRLVGTGMTSPVGTAARVPETDQHQPSRRFLHGASGIQAAVWIVARLTEGLDHAHSRGLLHRDLKPANILLTADGTPMLLDFNLAAGTVPGFPEGGIRRAAVGGTLPYMAPEHLDAFNPRGTTPPEAVDERADIYALGLILFEMLAGEPPFPALHPATSVLESIRILTDSRRHVPSLRARCPQVPWSLDALVAKCLEFDPARRYAFARDLAEDLRRFLENLPMKHGPEPSFRERMIKFVRRHPGLRGSTSIALISLILLGLLGSAVVLGYGALQGLAARLQLRMFDRDFTQAQFLLNTADTSDDHLQKGIKRAGDALRYLGLGDRTPAPWAGWTRRLTRDEQRRLREQVVELIILEARAHERLATKWGTEDDRRRAIERAIARLDQVERLESHVPAALLAARAQYHAALGAAHQAERDRRRAAETPPSSCHDWTLLGTTLLTGGDPSAAEDALRRALRVDVSSFWTWFILGHCHSAQGRFLEAAGDFAVCSVRGPDFAWVHFNHGLALANAGRLIDAKEAYDRALRIDPRFAEALVDRALVELQLDQLEGALADLTRARHLGRNEVGVLAALGETLARLGRPVDAEALFNGGLAQDPDNSVLRIARGMTRVRTDPEGARSDFDQVVRLDPRHALAHYGIALVIRAHDPLGAIRHLDTAIDTNPHLIDAVQLRALVRARRGDRAALDDVDRLLESPTSGRVYNAACAVTLYADTAPDTRQLPHALELLTRALRAGFPAAAAAADPDLKPLHALPEFQQLLARAGKRP